MEPMGAYDPCSGLMGWANGVPEMGLGNRWVREKQRWTPPVVGSRSCNKRKYLESGIA